MSNFEINFVVEESLDGGFEAKAIGYSIYTQGETIDDIKMAIREAVHCHFNDEEMPKIIRIVFIKEEVLAA
ncbi:MAG: 2-oxoisovalerate dehydrogenase [Ignavibacteriaceae bacterium]|nr:2-oxoisovalerate dehydrogenase [Ignavibacteriaceae bacterium]